MAVDDKDLQEATDLSVAPIVGPDDPRRFTDSGIEVKRLYEESDLPADLHERLGEPGRQTGEMFVDWIRGRGWNLKESHEAVAGREKPIRLFHLSV